MKIALCSSDVPFVNGGARNIVEWLHTTLEEAGHEVETVRLPEVDQPDIQFRQAMAFRWVDLSAADRVICFRPQAHLIDHPHKILWFIHHIRVYYDLWDSEYRDFPEDERHLAFRDALHQVDSKAIHEARAVFTNSKAVSARLKRFNGIDSEVLYPPVLRPERFRCDRYGDEIVVVARLEHHKRPHLLIEALALTTSAVQLRLVGAAFSADYVSGLTARTHNLGLDRRVTIENRWISEEEKADLLAGALATAYIAFDEDSYGYGSVEASHARKPILTTTDAGGVLELVKDGVNGYVTAPTPAALAEAMDKLFLDRKRTEAMGSKAADRLVELGVTWERVLDRLLA